MAHLVKYFHTPEGQNAGISVAFGDWPARILKHRGWSEDRLIYTRVATAEESAWIESCMRFQAFRYDTVEGLLEDEAMALKEWPGILESLRTRLSPISLSQ